MNGGSEKRRQIVVDAHMQVGVSMHLVGLLYVYFLGFALVVNASAVWNVIVADGASPDYVEGVNRLRDFARFAGIPLVLTFLCMAVHGVYFTHRLAGPVYRFKATLRSIVGRHVPRNITLRTKDFMKDLAEEFNAALQVLREDEARKRRMNDETLEAARALLAAADKPGADVSELSAAAHGVLDAAERLERHLAANGAEAECERVPVADAEPQPVGSAG